MSECEHEWGPPEVSPSGRLTYQICQRCNAGKVSIIDIGSTN